MMETPSHSEYEVRISRYPMPLRSPRACNQGAATTKLKVEPKSIQALMRSPRMAPTASDRQLRSTPTVYAAKGRPNQLPGADQSVGNAGQDHQPNVFDAPNV
jgi:hypothetical protein